jgi:diacylglycerol kinase family enzyme
MVALFMSAAVVPVWAHHAFAAEFDANKPVKFEATVTKMEWTNPHVWIHVEVKQPNGTVENWAFEAGTPNVLFRRGFTKNSLLPGTKIVLDGYRAKDGSRRANGRDVTFPDGKKLFLGSSGTGAPYELNGNADRP